MNILFVSNDPSIFEEESSARARMRAYAAEVAKAGGVLHILSRAKRRVEITDGALILHGISGNKLLALLRMKFRARSLVRKETIAVVSAQDPFEQGIIALHAVRGTQAKLHIQIHTDFLSPWFVRSGIMRSPKVRMPVLNRIRLQLAQNVLPHAHHIRVVSERIKESLIASYGERIRSVSVIPIHVDTTIPAPTPLPEPAFPFTLITAGRLEPEKRIEDILYALASIKDTYPAVGLVVVGSGSERPLLERLAHTLHIAERVRFLGMRTDVRGLMQSAQAYIQASAYEGYGITLIEAALSHIPIITTDVGVVGEVFGSDAVLAAPPGDPTQLMHHIRTLVEDPRVRAALPMRAEEAVKKHLASIDTSPSAIIRDIAATA